jgi:hypothetical protein
MINYSQDPFFTVYAVVVLAGVALGLIFLPSYFEVSDTERIGKGRVYVYLVEADTGRGSAVAATLTRTNADNLAVDGARDAVLPVAGVSGIDRVGKEHIYSLRYILGTVYSGNTEASEMSPAQYVSPRLISSSIYGLYGSQSMCVARTDSGGLNHVADGESLDCLVLGSASRAVGAADGLDVAAALLVATAIDGLAACPSCVSSASVCRRGVRAGLEVAGRLRTWMRAS